jgi:hypothetical protein
MDGGHCGDSRKQQPPANTAAVATIAHIGVARSLNTRVMSITSCTQHATTSPNVLNW